MAFLSNLIQGVLSTAGMSQRQKQEAFNNTTVSSSTPTSMTTGGGLYAANSGAKPVNASDYKPTNVNVGAIGSPATPQIDLGAFDPAKNNQTAKTQYQTGTSTGYDATKANTHEWKVEQDQLASNQAAGIIAQNSELMQRAAAKANEQSNSRGLLNSSMAVGAAQGAVMDAATPLAQSNAQVLADAAKTNTAAKNSTEQFNAGQTNAAAQFTANAKNQQNLANQESANAASRLDSQNENARLQQLTQIKAQATLANHSSAAQASLAQYDAGVKAALANADAANKQTLTALDGAIKTNLAQIEAQYKIGLQTQQSMQNQYQQYLQAVQAVMVDKDMDANSKQAAINNLTTNFNGSMGMLENLSGLKLGSLLTGGSPTPGPYRPPGTYQPPSYEGSGGYRPNGSPGDSGGYPAYDYANDSAGQ